MFHIFLPIKHFNKTIRPPDIQLKVILNQLEKSTAIFKCLARVKITAPAIETDND